MKKFSSLILILLTLNSCEEYTGEYSEYIKSRSVDTEVRFYPIEIYEEYWEVDTAKLKLEFQSTKMFPISSFLIFSTTFFDGDELIIRFDSIPYTGTGPTTPGPATLSIDLPEKTKRLALINGSSIDLYKVDVTEDYAELMIIDQDYTHLRHNKIFRYPENTFAYQCKVDTSNTHVYYDFLEILIDSLNITVFNFEGEGRVPYAEDWIENSKTSMTKYFKYDNELEFDKAGDLLEDYTRKYIEPDTYTSIRLISWNNRKHKSWMYDR